MCQSHAMHLDAQPLPGQLEKVWSLEPIDCITQYPHSLTHVQPIKSTNTVFSVPRLNFPVALVIMRVSHLTRLSISPWSRHTSYTRAICVSVFITNVVAAPTLCVSTAPCLTVWPAAGCWVQAHFTHCLGQIYYISQLTTFTHSDYTDTLTTFLDVLEFRIHTHTHASYVCTLTAACNNRLVSHCAIFLSHNAVFLS